MGFLRSLYMALWFALCDLLVVGTTDIPSFLLYDGQAIGRDSGTFRVVFPRWYQVVQGGEQHRKSLYQRLKG